MAEVSERLLRKIELALNNIQQKEDWISEEEACSFLGISKKTIQNLVCSQKIPCSAWAKTVNGSRVYIKSKLIIPIHA